MHEKGFIGPKSHGYLMQIYNCYVDDQQVKIRGFRKNLIEQELLKHEAIKEAVVIDRQDQNSNKYLCAYITEVRDQRSEVGSDKELKFHFGLSVSKIRADLAKTLPDYMIPAYIVILNKLPLTANGKVNRRALPEPDGSMNLGVEYVAPTNEVEEKLVVIWSVLLGIDKIGMHDNFFALGGHSLKATGFVMRVSKEFGMELPLRQFFQSPTIREIAQYMANVKKDDYIKKSDNIVLLKKGTEKEKHFFFIHDGSGDVSGYLEFCQKLNLTYNCWGIKADFSDEDLIIEMIAHKYVTQMKMIQPTGPYYLAGWSLGGVIGFEMIKQLEAAGDTIDFFGIIDSVVPTDAVSEVEVVEFESALKYLKQNSLDLDTIKRAIPPHIARLIPRYEQMSRRELIDQLDLICSLDKGLGGYKMAGPVNTVIHYFKAKESKETRAEQWSKYSVNPINSFEVEGDHFSIFKSPQVVRFAELFEKTLLERF